MDEYEDKYISAKELVNTMLEEAKKLPDDLPKGEGLAIATASQYIRGYIKRVKSADVHPVKHGQWKTPVSVGNGIKFCSVCRNEAYWDTDYGQQLFDYCPYCGARMDLKEGDEE